MSDIKLTVLFKTKTTLKLVFFQLSSLTLLNIKCNKINIK